MIVEIDCLAQYILLCAFKCESITYIYFIWNNLIKTLFCVCKNVILIIVALQLTIDEISFSTLLFKMCVLIEVKCSKISKAIWGCDVMLIV